MTTNNERAAARIAKAQEAVEAAERRRDAAILAARNSGLTLMELAEVLGTSHQAVATRLGRIAERLAVAS